MTKESINLADVPDLDVSIGLRETGGSDPTVNQDLVIYIIVLLIP